MTDEHAQPAGQGAVTPAPNRWKLSDGRTLLLLAPRDLAALPDGTQVICIDGTTATKGQDIIDNDTRFGYLAYGMLDTRPAVTDDVLAKALKLLEALASPHEMSDASGDHEWRKCRPCLAAFELSISDVHDGETQTEAQKLLAVILESCRHRREAEAERDRLARRWDTLKSFMTAWGRHGQALDKMAELEREP
ncbi:MAG: hypothetical protein WC655_23630 [Candidatus Hydrogenedentales bacterium]|jgi:hypothetical protein